jgi:hypothetical protein
MNNMNRDEGNLPLAVPPAADPGELKSILLAVPLTCQATPSQIKTPNGTDSEKQTKHHRAQK